MSDPRRALSMVVLDGADGRPAQKCGTCRSYLVWVVATPPLVDRLRSGGHRDPSGTYCMGKIGALPCLRALATAAAVGGLREVLR